MAEIKVKNQVAVVKFPYRWDSACTETNTLVFRLGPKTGSLIDFTTCRNEWGHLPPAMYDELIDVIEQAAHKAAIKFLLKGRVKIKNVQM